MNDEYINSIDINDWYRKLRADFSNFGLILYFVEIHQDNKTATVGVGNKQHLLWADAISIAQQVTDLYLPKKISKINFVAIEDHIRVNKIETHRYIPNNLLGDASLYENIELTLTNVFKSLLTLSILVYLYKMIFNK